MHHIFFLKHKHFLYAVLILSITYLLLPLSIYDSESGFIILLFLMPLLTVITCFTYGCTSKAKIYLPLVSVGITFLSLVLYFDHTDLSILLFYAFLSFISFGSGCLFRSHLRKVVN